MPNPLSPALYDRIRPRSYAADRVVTFFGNTVILTGRVTSDLVTPKSWGEFDYDMSTGDYTAVKSGMYMLMGTVNDITLATYIEGRARYDVGAGAVATASKIYCNESSVDFSATVGYFWILDNRLPQIKLSRPSTSDPTTAIQLADWNEPYQGIPPRITGVRMIYADYVNPLTGKLRIAVDMSSSAAQESGNTLASILTTIDGCTVLAGSLSGYMFIVDVDPGKQWAETTLIDSGGVAQTRSWFIHAADADNPPDVGMLGNTIENRFDTGWTMTLPAIAGVDDLLPNTFAAAWRTNQQTVLADGTWVTGDLWGGASATITNKVLTSNVATITTSTTHSFLAGQSIIVISNDSAFNGTFAITAVTTTTFSYAKTHANVGSAAATGMAATNADNVDFGGWMQTENDQLSADLKYSVLSQANFTFLGIGPRMAKLFGQQLGFLNAASATTYEQIVNCTPYRTVARFLASYSTVATLANIDYDAYDNTYLFGACIIQAQDMLSACKALLYQINANPEWSANGGLHIGRDATFLGGAGRAPLAILLSWTSADPMTPSSLTRDIDPNPGTGKVDADGTFYKIDSAATGQVFTSRAPGSAQGSAAGNDSLRNQILAATSLPGEARDELELRAGSLLDFDNLNEFLHCVHRDATVGLADWASRTRFYWWLLDGTEAGPNGVNRVGPYDTLVYWLLDSRTSVYNPDKGTFDEKRDFRRLIPPASPGDDTTPDVPPPGNVEPSVPDFVIPAFDFQDPTLGYPEAGLPIESIPPAALAPPAVGSLKMNGNELFTWSTTHAYINRKVLLLTSPPATDITPSDLDSFLIQQICTDPASNFPYTPGAYLLANDGTNSAVWYTNDASSAAGWTKGAELTGVYSVMRVTKTPGTVTIYSVGTALITDDFTTGSHGWTAVLASGSPIGTYVPATGWTTTDLNRGGAYFRSIYIGKSIASSTITAFIATYTAAGTSDFGNSGGDPGSRLQLDSNFESPTGWPTPTGTNITLSWSGSLTVTSLYVDLKASINVSSALYTGTLLLTKVQYGTGSATGALATSSTDWGATWGTPQAVGDSPGSAGGFDIQRAGGVSYAAFDQGLSKATGLGGPYSAYQSFTGSEVVCAIIPYCRRNVTTSNTSTSTPDVVVALNGADSDGGSLYWLDSAGTKTDITPTAGMTFQEANCITTRYGNEICVFGTVSGVKKLYRSTNGGTSWTLVTSLTTPKFIRCRRNDNTPSPNGQLYIAQNSTYYFSKKWASAGISVRNGPAITGLETIF